MVCIKNDKQTQQHKNETIKNEFYLDLRPVCASSWSA
jgi:hypothetical protein